jgi:DNA-binding winged helix-turn-helix (wHTH) protein
MGLTNLDVKFIVQDTTNQTINGHLMHKINCQNLVVVLFCQSSVCLFSILAQYKLLYPFLNIFIISYNQHEKLVDFNSFGLNPSLVFDGSSIDLKRKIDFISTNYLSRARDSKKIQIAEDIIYLPIQKILQSKKDGKIQKLRSKESELLDFFLYNSNKILSKEILMEAVWGYQDAVFSRTLEVHLANLRKKLIQFKSSIDIKTIYSKGYLLELK